MDATERPPAEAARHEEGSLEGAGGLRLFRQAWTPAGAARAVVVLSHGLSEHSGRYAWVAGQLAARGFAVHALDHRGHGRSEGGRAFIDRVGNAVADLDALVSHAQAAHPGLPVVLLGHSVGGCIAIAYALEHQDRLAALALSAPLAALEAAPAWLRACGRALSVLAPATGVYAVDSAKVSRDPAVVRDYDEDPLNHHGKVPARTVAELAATIERFPAEAPRLTLPLLVMHAPGDELVPFRGAEIIHAGASSADKTLLRYDGLAHELLNEPEREQVLEDLAGWIAARV